MKIKNNNLVVLAVKTEVDRTVCSVWDRVQYENSRRRDRDNASVLSPIRLGYHQKFRLTGLLQSRFYYMGTRRIFFVCLFV